MRFCFTPIKTMTVVSIVNIATVTGFSEANIKATITAMVAVIAAQIRNGEEVSIQGFGGFKINDKPERPGTHPGSRKKQTFPAIRSVKFELTKSFKDLVQPDPVALAESLAAQSSPAIEPVSEPVSEPVAQTSKKLPPPIPAELLEEAVVASESRWTIKAPDNGFVELPSSELKGWGVNAQTPIFSSVTGEWKRAGTIPELASIFPS